MIMRALVRVLATAATLLVLSRAGVGIEVTGLYSALVVAVLWGLISITIKPILQLLSLPITLLTFGLFSFVINALLFWLLATFVSGFSVAGFIPALVGSLVLAAVSWALHRALK